MLKFLFGGDVVLREERALCPSPEMADLIAAHDHFCCNFEGPVLTEGHYPKIGPGVMQCKAAPALLKDLGVDIACLGNNHIYDGGESGLRASLAALRENGLHTLGAGLSPGEIYAPLLFCENGERVAILNAAEDGFGCQRMLGERGYAWLFSPAIRQSIRELHEQGYCVILVAHAGMEEVNYPLPEWKAAYEELIECGADLVVAHHPHVVQGWEAYKEGYIYFSLGNFIWQNKTNPVFDSMALSVTVKEGRLERPQEIFTHYEEGRLSLCEDGAAISQMQDYAALLLDPPAYLARVDAECRRRLGEVYPAYYRSALNLTDCRTLLSRIKAAVKVILRGGRVDPRMMYHNLGIETHSWAYQRILRQIIAEEDKAEE